MAGPRNVRTAKEAIRVGATGLEPVTPSSEREENMGLAETRPKALAHSLAREVQKRPEIDAKLARVLDAWHGLSEPIRRAILALVDTAH
jgi:hypothetical protein